MLFLRRTCKFYFCSNVC